MSEETIDGRPVWQSPKVGHGENLELGRDCGAPAQAIAQSGVPDRPAASPSDTPETDAQLTEFGSISKYQKRFTNRRGVVSAAFARRLERERNNARLSLKHAMEAECFDCAPARAAAANMEHEVLRLRGIIARNAMDLLEGEDGTKMHVTKEDITASLEILDAWKKEVGYNG